MNQKNIIIAAIVVLALAGGGYYFWSKLPTQQAAKNKEAVDNVKLEDLKMKINLSPMPELSLSSFGLAAPQLAGLNIFSGVSINSDFSYQINSITIAEKFRNFPSTRKSLPIFFNHVQMFLKESLG